MGTAGLLGTTRSSSAGTDYWEVNECFVAGRSVTAAGPHTHLFGGLYAGQELSVTDTYVRTKGDDSFSSAIADILDDTFATTVSITNVYTNLPAGANNALVWNGNDNFTVAVSNVYSAEEKIGQGAVTSAVVTGSVTTTLADMGNIALPAAFTVDKWKAATGGFERISDGNGSTYHYLRHFMDPELYTGYTGWDTVPTMKTLTPGLQLDRQVGFLTSTATQFSFNVMLPVRVQGRVVVRATTTASWLEILSSTEYMVWTTDDWTEKRTVKVDLVSAPASLSTAEVIVTIDTDRTHDVTYTSALSRTVRISSEATRYAGENRLFAGSATGTTRGLLLADNESAETL